MSFARKSIDVASVDLDQFENVVNLLYAATSPVDDDEVRRGDGVIDPPEMVDFLDTLAASCDGNRETAGALFQRALALQSFCSKEQPPEPLMKGGVPSRLLCAIAAMAPVVQIPGNGNLATFDFEPDAIRNILAAAIASD